MMRQRGHRYRGVPAGPVRIVSVDGGPLPPTALTARLAPDSYDWGTRSTSALALAHALLSYECDTRTADAAYVAFQREVIAALPRGAGGEAWSLTSAEIRPWLEEHQRTRESGEQS